MSNGKSVNNIRSHSDLYSKNNFQSKTEYMAVRKTWKKNMARTITISNAFKGLEYFSYLGSTTHSKDTSYEIKRKLTAPECILLFQIYSAHVPTSCYDDDYL